MTVGEIGIAWSTGTSRQPSTTWPSALTVRFEFLLAGETRRVFLRQKDHPDAVFARGRQRNALARHFLAIERVGNLDQDPRAIAHQRVGTDGAPVVEVFEDLQTLFDDAVAFLALDMGDKADTAGVMFIGRIVEPCAAGTEASVPRIGCGSFIWTPCFEGRVGTADGTGNEWSPRRAAGLSLLHAADRTR